MGRPSLNAVTFVLLLIVATLAVVMTANADNTPPDYEAQANCIAEYDYHHPERSQYSNLVLALSECR